MFLAQTISNKSIKQTGLTLSLEWAFNYALAKHQFLSHYCNKNNITYSINKTYNPRYSILFKRGRTGLLQDQMTSKWIWRFLGGSPWTFSATQVMTLITAQKTLLPQRYCNTGMIIQVHRLYVSRFHNGKLLQGYISSHL